MEATKHILKICPANMGINRCIFNDVFKLKEAPYENKLDVNLEEKTILIINKNEKTYYRNADTPERVFQACLFNEIQGLELIKDEDKKQMIMSRLSF